MGLQLRPAMAPALESSNSNMTGVSTEAKWIELAKELWLSSPHPPDSKPETIKTRIWDALETEKFDSRSISLLENLQVLERYTRYDKSEVIRSLINIKVSVAGI